MALVILLKGFGERRGMNGGGFPYIVLSPSAENTKIAIKFVNGV